MTDPEAPTAHPRHGAPGSHRSILGLGAGWHVSEHEGYGWGFPARIEEALAHQTRPPEVVRPRILGGDASAMVEQLRAFAEAGVQHVILHVGSPYDLVGLEAFAREVIPAFRD